MPDNFDNFKNYHSMKIIRKREKMGQPVKNGTWYKKCTLGKESNAPKPEVHFIPHICSTLHPT